MINTFVNFIADEIEIYRCLILGESSLEQSLCEKKYQARELGADETFKKSRDYLVQGLQLCNKSIERFVSFFTYCNGKLYEIS